MRKALKFAALTVALVIGFTGFWFLIPKTTSFGMFAGEGAAKLGRLLLSFSATIAGVVLG